MLLQNKKIVLLSTVILGILFLFISCNKNGNKNSEQLKESDLLNQENLKNFLKQHSITDYSIALYDKFIDITKSDIFVGKEITNQSEWGIKFILYSIKKDSLIKIFESKLLDGSFNESKVEVIQIPDYQNKLIYYNSQDYFMGSQSGEVFSYIVDFKLKEIYYAHLSVIPGKPISLYLSENIKNEVIKNYFKKDFINDYPNLILAKNDTKIEM